MRGEQLTSDHSVSSAFLCPEYGTWFIPLGYKHGLLLWGFCTQSICLGFKSSLFALLAGEMSHHDVLDAAAKGINVVLCEHSNTERGFLSDLQGMLGVHLENRINIILSETDRDPLCVV